MNTIKPRLTQNRYKRRSQAHKFCNFCVHIGCLILLVCLATLTLSAADTETDEPSVEKKAVGSPLVTAQEKPLSQETASPKVSEDVGKSKAGPVETDKEVITGTSNKMERFDKEGITILIGEAKTVRYNAQGIEIGFLNADKITMKSDPTTGTTTEIIAEGSVEIRDQDIFATCDHAIMNNLTNTVVLKENVVVLQNKDRLETKLFTFNRTTGKQTGEGGVKFKVSVTQAAPVTTETDQNSENGEKADGSESGSQGAPTEADAKKETDADAGAEKKSEADESESGSQSPPTEADSEAETDTDTENPDDADADAETEEAEKD